MHQCPLGYATAYRHTQCIAKFTRNSSYKYPVSRYILINGMLSSHLCSRYGKIRQTRTDGTGDISATHDKSQTAGRLAGSV